MPLMQANPLLGTGLGPVINHRSINSYYIGRGGREVVGGERCGTEIVATDLVWLTFLYISLLTIAGGQGGGSEANAVQCATFLLQQQKLAFPPLGVVV